MDEAMLIGICRDCCHCARLRCMTLDPSEPVPIAFYCKWRNRQLNSARDSCPSFRGTS